MAFSMLLSSFALFSLFLCSDASTIKRDNGVYQYIGCYPDSSENRILPSHQGTGFPQMNVEECQQWCIASLSSYAYFGVEYGKECFCGWKLHYDGPPVSNSECNMPCVGVPSEICGGSERISVYYDPQARIPTIGAPIAGWEYVGCYTDSTADRTIATRVNNGGTQSSESCTQACQTGGYIYAGVEYGNECYCGNELGGSGTLASADDCDMQCYGSFYEICGGSDRINVYHKSI